MRILLNENVPHALRHHLGGHETATAVYAGFGGFRNGTLLSAAEAAGFDVLVTGDRSLEYQQTLSGRKLAIITLSANSWGLIRNNIAAIVSAIENAGPGRATRVDCGVFRRPERYLPGG